MSETWIADRMRRIDASGIRKVFDLAAKMTDPINLSIGQPHFDTPEPIKQALYRAVAEGKNAYSQTQGIAPLLEKIQHSVDSKYGHADRKAFISSGTSGGLLLALLATVNPGDEVVTADPYFVAYPNMVAVAGGRMVAVDTYPDFRLDLNRLADAITPRTKAVLLSTPSNPTGAVIDAATQKELADLCRARRVLLVSDEIYRAFQYDAPHVSPATFDPNVLVVEGFGKTYGMTGWRLGWAHGPTRLIQEMAKFQQFTFVCAPSIVQHAGVAALNYDASGIVADYRRKRDLLVAGLKDDYEFAVPGGAFYLFPKAPWGTGTEFVTEAIARNLLIIPGGVFSGRDTHVRISYAASDETLHRGIEIMRALARR